MWSVSGEGSPPGLHVSTFLPYAHKISLSVSARREREVGGRQGKGRERREVARGEEGRRGRQQHLFSYNGLMMVPPS